MEPIVIVGTGQAGYGLAREYRKLDPERPLCLITEGDGAAYYKPNLSKALAGGQQPDDLVMNPRQRMSEQLGAAIVAGAAVRALQPERRVVLLDDGELVYHRLVIACGADALALSVPGDGRLHTVNSLEDYRAFRADLDGRRNVVVIGAGLIGCEFANDLAIAGFSVTVVDVEARPLARLAPPAVGAAVMAGLAAIGVQWELATGVTAIHAEGAGQRVELANGKMLHADVVLCAIGQRPRTAFAAAAGLEVGAGIRVDRHLRTSDPCIYALGDCAEIGGRVRPFVAPITHAAKALANTLVGAETPVVFPPMPIVVKTPACPTVLLPPDTAQSGQWEIAGEGADLEALYKDAEGRLLGFALTGSATARRMELSRALSLEATSPTV